MNADKIFANFLRSSAHFHPPLCATAHVHSSRRSDLHQRKGSARVPSRQAEACATSSALKCDERALCECPNIQADVQFRTTKEARKNNFPAADVARTLSLRLRDSSRRAARLPAAVEKSLDPAGTSACATSIPPDKAKLLLRTSLAPSRTAQILCTLRLPRSPETRKPRT